MEEHNQNDYLYRYLIVFKLLDLYIKNRPSREDAGKNIQDEVEDMMKDKLQQESDTDDDHDKKEEQVEGETDPRNNNAKSSDSRQTPTRVSSKEPVSKSTNLYEHNQGRVDVMSSMDSVNRSASSDIKSVSEMDFDVNAASVSTSSSSKKSEKKHKRPNTRK